MSYFLKNLKAATNFKKTENGATAHESTLNKVYDLFAFGGSYRNRDDNDCILLFKEAFEENETLALKCLFYLRDIRGGAGERRFFRVCFHWLAVNHPEAAHRNLDYVSEYGRWDDLIYTCFDTPLENYMLGIIRHQLALDVQCKTPSLLAKWMPSCNASSKTTKVTANRIRDFLHMTQKEYRKTLSELRSRINIVEKLMSSNKWHLIQFDKIPSKAGLIYKNAFARRDILQKKYASFIKDKNTTVNADTLFPYEIVNKARYVSNRNLDNVDRCAVNKYWENQKDYFNGKYCKMLCVCDTSGSMTWSSNSILPIDVAISLSLYCAERLNGPFKNHYISFASRPQLIETKGVDFVDKVERIRKTNLCDNTNLLATFDLLKKISLQTEEKDQIDTLVIISDMEIDEGTEPWRINDRVNFKSFQTDTIDTEMEQVRKEWAAVGLKLPHLVYWNANSRNNTILDLGPNVSYVSGASPSIFESILTGKQGIDLMLEKILSDRYNQIK